MTNANGRYLGDDAFEPLFAELDRRRAVVFLRPTSPAGWKETALGRPRPMIEHIFDTTRTVTDLLSSGVLERHANLPVIVPHCGGALPVLVDRVNEFSGLFLGANGTEAPEAATQLRRLFYDIAGPAFPREGPALLGVVDPDRLLFGSDYCWTPPAVVAADLAAIDAAPTPVEGTTWRSLTTANASRLFGESRVR